MSGTPYSHSIINESRKSVWLKDLAVIDMTLYRRVYRQKNTPFAGAGLRGIGLSSISFNHTEPTTALQLPQVDAFRHAPRWAVSRDVRELLSNLVYGKEARRHSC